MQFGRSNECRARHRIFVGLAALVVLITAISPLFAAEMATLEVVVSNARNTKGLISVAIYDDNPETFLEVAYREIAVPVEDDLRATIIFEGLAPGEYAVTVIHDENMNDKLDTRIFGIPKEPYAFANGWRPKLRGPKFDEIKVAVPPEGLTIEIIFP